MGGSGEHWTGIVPRFLPDAFELHTRTIERYGAKRLPENHSIQDWGITYAELEPFYTRAERLLGVSGKTGSDPFEGPRSAEYPTPPLKMGYLPSLFVTAARSLGYHPSPTPSANISTPSTWAGTFRPVPRVRFTSKISSSTPAWTRSSHFCKNLFLCSSHAQSATFTQS